MGGGIVEVRLQSGAHLDARQVIGQGQPAIQVRKLQGALIDDVSEQRTDGGHGLALEGHRGHIALIDDQSGLAVAVGLAGRGRPAEKIAVTPVLGGDRF